MSARRGLGGLLWRGIRRKCAQCGQGQLVHRWFRIAERCPSCGWRLDRGERGYWTGAMAINLIITQIVPLGVFIIVALATWPDVPWGAITAVCVALAVLLPVALFPFSRTIWMAIDQWWNPPDGAVSERDRARRLSG